MAMCLTSNKNDLIICLFKYCGTKPHGISIRHVLKLAKWTKKLVCQLDGASVINL